MPGLKLQVTNAGRAALVNAPNTGTNAVLVSQVGIASAPFTASPELIALPNEIKRIDTVGGTISAADTVHVSVRDESTAVYDCYGFGLYLSDGTLFAVYSQPTLLLGKAAAAMMLLALDAVFADIDVQQLAFGDTNFTDPAATTEMPGIVELATEQEATAGTDKVRSITSWLLKKVLDARLGVGAPSDFAKTLLGLATAALFRASLEIKSAALKDEGADNGLDADKLDGQHGAWYRQWANLTGVPATATAWPTWDQVQSKPATFPPSAHSHADYVQKAGDTMSGLLVAPGVRVYEAGASNQLYFRNAGGVMTIDSVNPQNNAWMPLNFTATGFSFNGGSVNIPGGLNCSGGTFTGGVTFNGNLNQIQYTNGGYTRLLILSSGGDCGIYDQNAQAWGLRYDVAGYTSARSGFLVGGSSLTNTQVHVGSWTIDQWGQFTSANTQNPGSGLNSFNLRLVGAFGGGLGFIDGNYNIGLWSENGNFCVGTAVAGGALTKRLELTTGGALSSTGGYGIGSSIKLKNVIGPLCYGLDELERLDTVVGRYKPAYNDDDRNRLFLIAEQLLELMPETVDAEGAQIDGEKMPAIKIEQLLPVFVRAFKQVAGRLRLLEAEVTELRQVH